MTLGWSHGHLDIQLTSGHSLSQPQPHQSAPGHRQGSKGPAVLPQTQPMVAEGSLRASRENPKGENTAGSSCCPCLSNQARRKRLAAMLMTAVRTTHSHRACARLTLSFSFLDVSGGEAEIQAVAHTPHPLPAFRPELPSLFQAPMFLPG